MCVCAGTARVIFHGLVKEECMNDDPGGCVGMAAGRARWQGQLASGSKQAPKMAEMGREIGGEG